jgi:oxalate decarboxylase/phosphoglucose isomerase-like protein (cupin superfamily)
MISTKIHKELEDVLLEPKAPGVKESYFVIQSEEQNITVLNPGKNGIEYNKTYGHFHKFLGVEIYVTLFGQGVLIMQRNDENGEAKEFKVVTLHPGKQVEIPSGFGHVLINIGKGFLVVLDQTGKRADKWHNYEPVKAKRGLAYYIVEKKGEIAFDVNPAYRVHPQISTE